MFNILHIFNFLHGIHSFFLLYFYEDLFFRFTIDIFTSVAFGVQLQSFDRDDQHPFAKAFDAIQVAVITRVPNPCW